MAVELRWVVPDHTTTESPRLQYRQCREWPNGWSDWLDVPLVVAPRPKACTCRDGFGRPRCPIHEAEVSGAPATVGLSVVDPRFAAAHYQDGRDLAPENGGK